MEDLNYNNILNVVEYLNVIDLGRFAATSKRHCYLVHEFQRLRGPEVVTVASWDRTTFQQRPAATVVGQSLQKLQTKPNLVLAFNTRGRALENGIKEQSLPPNTVVLGVCADSIQVNLGANNVESQSSASVMYASFPNADIRSFAFDRSKRFSANLESEMNDFATDLASMTGAKEHWKALIVYSNGNGSVLVDPFLLAVQAKLPDVAIVGGNCNEGYLGKTPSTDSLSSTATITKEELKTKPVKELRRLIDTYGGKKDVHVVEKSELVDLVFQLQKANQTQNKKVSLEHMEDAIYGVVLGGDVPVKSIVSRGVESIIHGGEPQPNSPYIVKTVKLTRPDDEDFVFRGADLQPIHMIQDLTNKETSTTVSAMDFISQAGNRAEFVGVKRPQEDGFELHMLSPYCQAVNALLIMTDGSKAQEKSLEGAEIDFFTLSGDACCRHMTNTAELLREQTRGEEILGAVMFSCAGRGPQAGGLIPEPMSDATRFANVFPDVPCLGFYAGGEIGPLALAANQNVFRKGKATVQGFTAVFCLFIVPAVNRCSYMLDDSPNAVDLFVKERFN